MTASSSCQCHGAVGKAGAAAAGALPGTADNEAAPAATTASVPVLTVHGLAATHTRAWLEWHNDAETAVTSRHAAASVKFVLDCKREMVYGPDHFTVLRPQWSTDAGVDEPMTEWRAQTILVAHGITTHYVYKVTDDAITMALIRRF